MISIYTTQAAFKLLSYGNTKNYHHSLIKHTLLNQSAKLYHYTETHGNNRFT